MPEAEREKILARKKLYFYGDPSRVNMKRLRDELAQCRKRGFARDVGDLQHGINAVSAPVFGPDEKIIGCVILIGTFPEALIEKYGHKVTNAVKKISQKLGADVEQFYSSS
jgi:DNA-binding IclR family transcriptional regulator